MSPLFVSFFFHTYDGSRNFGDCILHDVGPIKTAADIEDLKKRAAVVEGIKARDMTIQFWRRME